MTRMTMQIGTKTDIFAMNVTGVGRFFLDRMIGAFFSNRDIDLYYRIDDEGIHVVDESGVEIDELNPEGQEWCEAQSLEDLCRFIEARFAGMSVQELKAMNPCQPLETSTATSLTGYTVSSTSAVHNRYFMLTVIPGWIEPQKRRSTAVADPEFPRCQ